MIRTRSGSGVSRRAATTVCAAGREAERRLPPRPSTALGPLVAFSRIFEPGVSESESESESESGFSVSESESESESGLSLVACRLSLVACSL